MEERLAGSLGPPRTEPASSRTCSGLAAAPVAAVDDSAGRKQTAFLGLDRIKSAKVSQELSIFAWSPVRAPGRDRRGDLESLRLPPHPTLPHPQPCPGPLGQLLPKEFSSAQSHCHASDRGPRKVLMGLWPCLWGHRLVHTTRDIGASGAHGDTALSPGPGPGLWLVGAS